MDYIHRWVGCVDGWLGWRNGWMDELDKRIDKWVNKWANSVVVLTGGSDGWVG